MYLYVPATLRLNVTTNKSSVYIYSNLQCHSERIEAPLNKCVSGEHEYKMYKLTCDA